VAIPNGYYNGSLTEVWPYKGFVFGFGNSGGVENEAIDDIGIGDGAWSSDGCWSWWSFPNIRNYSAVKSVVALGRVPCWRLQANTCLFLGLARMISGFVFYIIIVIINLVWNCVINGVQLKFKKYIYFQNYFNMLILKINFKK